MTDRELMQMVLDALSNFDKGNHGMRWQVPLVKALRARLSQLNDFNPDWDAMAVMVEEQQRMAKRIEELTQLVTSQGIRLMDAEAQSEQEPVAWGLQQQFEGKIGTAPVAFKRHDEFGFVVPLYAAPPHHEWVGLTDEEMMQIYVALKSVAGFYSIEKYARAIEVNLKEKNNG